MNIVALKVTDGTNTASLDSIANALQWVINNHAQYNITVVNMSLSDGQNYAQNWFATGGGAAEQVTNLIGQLRGDEHPGRRRRRATTSTGSRARASRRSSRARSA